MNINIIRALFMWCTIINGGLLTGTFLFYLLARNFATTVHSKLFNVPKEMANTMYYSFIELYKMLWILFNLVPWIVLLIIK
jgi:hypothetical protein